MKFSRLNIVVICFWGLVLAGCSALSGVKGYYSESEDVSVIPAVGSIPQRVELEQGWDDATRQKFWFTSQGSRILPYSWFTWLELANSQELFRSAEHMESLRYLPSKSADLNPSGLPIGFALDHDKEANEAWLGMTCAACHTTQIDYQGTQYLIEGGPTLANFVLFYSQLIDAMNATHKDDAKFDRFARRVLGVEYSDKNAAALRQQLFNVALAAAERQEVNSLPEGYPEDFTSYGRLDAFGNIQNAGTAFALNDVTNKNTPNAPVSYPFLWGTHQSDVVQWNASAPNTPVVGPLVRNIGEVVGVFGGLEIKKAPWHERLFGKKLRYSSSVDMIGLGNLESWVKTLRSPLWPDAFPAINVNKAAAGKALYIENCSSCHELIPRSKEGDNYIAVKTPLLELGTDPGQAVNAKYHQAKTLVLEGTKETVLFGDDFKATAAAIDIPVNGVVGVVLKDPLKALEAGLIPERVGSKRENEKNTEDQLKQLVSDFQSKRDELGAKGSEPEEDLSTVSLKGLVYKARPLNGIWATAPYLHNGSVANLMELLVAPDKRKKHFWVGSREFDPVNVGFVTGNGLNEFQVLNEQGATQKGNSNLGHDYGTSLSLSEKSQLVEYMKTL